MSLPTNLRELIETDLTSKLGITKWDSITFGILPEEESKGYFQIMKVAPKSLSITNISVAVGIAISATSLDDLELQIVTLVNSILEGYNNPRGCSGLGRVNISSSGIDVEMPQSYSQQNNISTTTGFFTAVAFIMEIMT